MEESERMFDSFYYIHVPKTGGRHLKYNVTNRLKATFKEKGIAFPNSEFDTPTTSSHAPWSNLNITDNTYLISVFREPSERLVSLFCHLKLKKHMHLDVPTAKIELFQWLDSNKDYLNDVQSKMVLFDDTKEGNHVSIENFDPSSDIAAPGIFKANYIDDKELLDSRLKRFNILMRMNDLRTDANVQHIREKILTDFDFPQNLISTPIRTNPSHSNKFSHELFDSLSVSEKQYLIDYNPMDTEVWNTDSYFYKFPA